MSGLIWVQAVCKDQQWTTKFTAGRLRFKAPFMTATDNEFCAENVYLVINWTNGARNIHNQFFFLKNGMFNSCKNSLNQRKIQIIIIFFFI